MEASLASVSVIIPTWNRAHTVVAAIESALSQSVPPLEVLVCDDGSNDSTQATVTAIEDQRVRFVAGSHSGRPAVARNRGIALSRGNWLAFLDSDDTWLPGKLAAQLDLVHAQECLAACGNALRVLPGIGAQGNLLDFVEPRLTFKRLLRENLVVCSAAMFHRSLLSRVGGFPEQASLIAAEDYALWLKIATLTDFAFVRSPCVAYTDNPAGSIRGVARDSELRRSQAVFGDYLRWAHPFERSALMLRWELLRRTLVTQKKRWATRIRISPR